MLNADNILAAAAATDPLSAAAGLDEAASQCAIGQPALRMRLQVASAVLRRVLEENYALHSQINSQIRRGDLQ